MQCRIIIVWQPKLVSFTPHLLLNYCFRLFWCHFRIYLCSAQEKYRRTSVFLVALSLFIYTYLFFLFSLLTRWYLIQFVVLSRRTFPRILLCGRRISPSLFLYAVDAFSAPSTVRSRREAIL